MKDLINRARKGDKMAVSELYSRTYKELYYYCSRLCKNDQDARDLVQDTYLTVLEKLEQYRYDENFKGWLHTIALHKYYNKRRSERPMVWEEDAADIPAEEELSCPEEYAENRELYRFLGKIISDKLTEPQRLTVIMFYYDEMNVSRIAEVLECSQGTVKSRLYYSRKLIRQELEKSGYILSGGVLVIAAAFGFESADFISGIALNSSLLADILSTKTIAKKFAAKSVKNYAKGKIIAGAAAIAVAGGAAAYNHAANKKTQPTPEPEPPRIIATIPAPPITVPATIRSPERAEVSTEAEIQPQTGVSVPGGELLEYDFPLHYFSARIPENFELVPSWNNREISEEQVNNRSILLSMSPKMPIRLRPDTFSGDLILMARSQSEDVFSDLEAALSEYFSDVEIGESSEITLAIDNTNAPELPTETTAQRTSFSAVSHGNQAVGTAIVCKHRVNTYLFAFVDCSGIRQEEYEAVIDSICFRYADNSWQDDYPHFNNNGA
ncbi:MAG: RNA polymerase sigma factor [Ruminococcus sp.]|nr:RNA polymerase sigma factor [Ruminococcus sp.]